jgi:hypothetical protein
MNSKISTKTSFGKGIAIACLVFVTTSNSLAQDVDRITQLEREVQDLKNRISRLESSQAGAKPNARTVPSGEGWKNLANWRSLQTGMTYDEVRSILGEPARIAGGEIAFWFYGNRGSVDFYQHRLKSWTEPR